MQMWLYQVEDTGTVKLYTNKYAICVTSEEQTQISQSLIRLPCHYILV